MTDPFSQRIHDAIQRERDRLRVENAELEKDNERLLACCREVANWNSTLHDRIRQLNKELVELEEHWMQIG